MKKYRILRVLLVVTLVLCALGAMSCKEDETTSSAYVVQFIADGKICQVVETMGSSVITLPSAPEKENYVFDGWYTDKDTFDNAFTADYLTKHPITDNLSVYAKYVSEKDMAKFEDGYGEDILSIAEVQEYVGSSLFYIESIDVYGNLNVGMGFFINKNGVGATTYNLLCNARSANITLANGTTYAISNVLGAQDGVVIFNTELNASSCVHIGEEDDVDGDSIIYAIGYSSATNISSESGTVEKKNALVGDSEYIQADLRTDFLQGAIILDRYGDVQGIKVDDVTVGDKSFSGLFIPSWKIESVSLGSGSSLYDYMRQNIKCNVTFRSDGVIIGTEEFAYGDLITAPTLDAKTGYNFAGWCNADGTVQYDLASYTVCENIELQADWQAIKYAINYNLGGGTNNIGNPNYYTIDSVNIDWLTPSRANYNFVKWEIAGQEVTQLKSGSMGDITIDALWEAIEFDISYDLNGGFFTKVNPTKYTVETSNFTLNNPTKIGYVFCGWSGTDIEDGSQTVNVNSATGGNRTYTATWQLCSEHVYEDCVCINCGKAGEHDVVNCVCTNCHKEIHAADTYCRHDDVIYYGSYPQTEVEDADLVVTLNNYAGTLPTATQAKAWTSFGYYVYGAKSAYMWYIDLSFGAERYRGVYFSSYRPYINTMSGEAENSYQDDNGYTSNKVYWFKYEPIKWAILSENAGKATIISELAIDCREYQAEYTQSGGHYLNGSHVGVYANNYSSSSIRAWLINEFYSTAFTEAQQAIAIATTISNNEASTNPNSNDATWNYGVNSNICADTQDKVWMLSEQEVTNLNFGFSAEYGQNSSRIKYASAYAKCLGIKCEESGSCSWELRSPDFFEEYYTYYVDENGASDVTHTVLFSASGIVPVMQITL